MGDGRQRCGRCKEMLPVEAFSPSYQGRNGTWCRACFASHMRGERGAMLQHQPRICEHCGQAYVPSQLKLKASYCSRSCKDRARKDRDIEARVASKAEAAPRICAHCAAVLPPTMRSDARFCSSQCNMQAHALQRKLRTRTGSDEKTGYLRAEIATRDKWRCGICRKPVKQNLRYPDPMCGSLDHVIPVSEGGASDPANLRLTHLKCNLERRNRGGNEQLAFI